MADLDTQAFSLAGGDVGCLLIHGFTASPYDMRFFAEKLHAAGCGVDAVCLAGHGCTVEEMEACSWQDWYASASECLTLLAKRTRRQVIVGQSMGALLALALAHRRRRQVDGLVLISTALVASNPYVDWFAPLIPWLAPWLPPAWRYLDKGESDISDALARKHTPTYRKMPLRSIHELHELQRFARTLLPKIRQPALVIHSRQDHACGLDNVALLERELAGPVRTVILQNSFHVVSVDVDKEQVAREICSFIETGLDEAP